MKIIFAGTPEFAAVALRALLGTGFDVPLVLTQPDRPAGRGMQVQASAVKQAAQEHHINVAQPHSLRLDGKYPEEAAQAHELIREVDADVMVVAAYGLLLPLSTLSLPRRGCINIHASLLPRWRGAAPIHRAIEAGDTETGVTIMQMDEGLDTGDMLLKGKIGIDVADTTASLHDKLAALGGDLVVQALRELDTLKATQQPADGVTYAAKIAKDEAALDFSGNATQLAQKIRAFNPFPGATGLVNCATLKFWNAIAVKSGGNAAAPGTVLSADAAGVVVQCGEGALLIKELQKPGGKRLAAGEFLKGFVLEGASFS